MDLTEFAPINRTYCLEETPICLAEATSEERALFEIVFFTTFLDSSSRLGVVRRTETVVPGMLDSLRVNTSKLASLLIMVAADLRAATDPAEWDQL